MYMANKRSQDVRQLKEIIRVGNILKNSNLREEEVEKREAGEKNVQRTQETKTISHTDSLSSSF